MSLMRVRGTLAVKASVKLGSLHRADDSSSCVSLYAQGRSAFFFCLFVCTGRATLLLLLFVRMHRAGHSSSSAVCWVAQAGVYSELLDVFNDAMHSKW
jgi:hypothetical protein